jgi:Cdc6-like AAA superfamily ATPase
MTDAQKKEIQILLKKHIEQYPSQKKAVDALRNVSEATVINIRTGKWESISDDMWRLIGKQIGFSAKGKWLFIPTSNSKTIMKYFDDAAEYGNVFAITADAGSSKSATAAHWEGKHHNAYHIECAEYFNRKVFLQNIMAKMGMDKMGYTVPEMMEEIVDALMKKENPLIILDEVDKLPDPVLYFFITFYNNLRGHCGIVLLATEYLAKRIVRGRRLGKKGYNEIFSRIGRRFISLKGVTKDEVEEIARQNGCDDPLTIASIYNECEGDLRRVERMVHKYKVKNQNKAA